MTKIQSLTEDASTRQHHYKLVRDRIPEIIQKSGCQCNTVVLSESEYRQALQEKLLEEAQEVTQANSDNLVMELADLLEVVEAIMECYGISKDAVVLAQDQKRAEKGGFEEKIKLLWTES